MAISEPSGLYAQARARPGSLTTNLAVWVSESQMRSVASSPTVAYSEANGCVARPHNPPPSGPRQWPWARPRTILSLHGLKSGSSSSSSSSSDPLRFSSTSKISHPSTPTRSVPFVAQTSMLRTVQALAARAPSSKRCAANGMRPAQRFAHPSSKATRGL